jgi:undecaprenyl-diphosphatase
MKWMPMLYSPAMVQFWSKHYWIDFFTNNSGFELYAMLFVISFTESCCFIIPPDPFLPLLTANRAFSGLMLIWFVTTAASVIGAAFGYWVGIKGGRPLVQKFFDPEKVKKVEDMYNKYDAMAVFIAAFTPIPYKVFTITGGVFRIHFWKFIVVSIFGRGIRYFIWALLGWIFKDAANAVLHQIDKVMAIIILFLLSLVVIMVVKNKLAKKAASQA